MSFPIITKTLHQALNDTVNEFDILLNSKAKLVKQEENYKTYTIPPSVEREFIDLNRRLFQEDAATSIVPQGLIVALISQYDAFLGQLIRNIYTLKPEVLNGLEKTITVKELAVYSSLDEVKEAIITKDIDGIMRVSHSEQLKEIEKRFSVSLSSKNIKAWASFIEVTERRNLFVHTDGVVSDQYIRVCREHNVALDKTVLVGTTLVADSKYFDSSYECVYQIGVLLSQALWRQIRPDEQNIAEENLTDICLNLILQNRYQIVIQILKYFIDTGRKFSSHDFELTIKLNLAQAYKWSGDQMACNQVIDLIDWSACSDKFHLAVAVLRDNFDEAAKLMRRIGPIGVVKASYYKEWPIFREFRETEQFRQGFREVFGEDFVGTKASIGEAEEPELLLESDHSHQSDSNVADAQKDTSEEDDNGVKI